MERNRHEERARRRTDSGSARRTPSASATARRRSYLSRRMAAASGLSPLPAGRYNPAARALAKAGGCRRQARQRAAAEPCRQGDAARRAERRRWRPHGRPRTRRRGRQCPSRAQRRRPRSGPGRAASSSSRIQLGHLVRVAEGGSTHVGAGAPSMQSGIRLHAGGG